MTMEMKTISAAKNQSDRQARVEALAAPIAAALGTSLKPQDVHSLALSMQSQRTANRPGKRPRYMVDIESDDGDSQSSADDADEDDRQHCSKKARLAAG